MNTKKPNPKRRAKKSELAASHAALLEILERWMVAAQLWREVSSDDIKSARAAIARAKGISQ